MAYNGATRTGHVARWRLTPLLCKITWVRLANGCKRPSSVPLHASQDSALC